MIAQHEPLDASVRSKYELKYLIVQRKMSPLKGSAIQFGVFFGPIAILMFLYFSLGGLFKEDTKLFLFIILQIVFIVFIVIINKPVNKKLRERETVGFVQFFPYHMIIEQNNHLQELNYENLFKVYYANGLLDDYFSKSPNAITYHYKFICKDKTTFFFECECFIRANRYDRKNKNLPDIGHVIKRILPPGGIHQSKKEIRKELKIRKNRN
jgi:hypothetical protein